MVLAEFGAHLAPCPCPRGDAGRHFFSVPGLPNNAEFVGYDGLAQFNRTSLIARPGLTIGWRHRDVLLDSADHEPDDGL